MRCKGNHNLTHKQMYGTHNAATGERGTGILSWLVTPFSKCQSKTLRQQYIGGVKLFDIRAKWYKGEWHCGHGLWTSKRTLMDIIGQLSRYGNVYVTLTVEGNDTDLERITTDGTLDEIRKKLNTPEHLHLVYLAVKKPTWRIVETYNHMIAGNINTDYEILDSHNWRRFIPIPYLWSRLRHPHPKSKPNTYTLVDFK